jgi:mRNA-degrading endonuclease RelE of RelBE toxin-antitoxin system
MPKRTRFAFVFAPEALDHLGALERKYHRVILKAIDEQLTYAPVEETRNRKPLDQPAPFAATWEMRCGPDNRFRVFYDVNSEKTTVSVLALGIKDRNRLFIGGEEYSP